jgi:hypothetical protein
MAHRLGGRNVGLEANREEDLVAGAVLRERGRNGTCMETKMVVCTTPIWYDCQIEKRRLAKIRKQERGKAARKIFVFQHLNSVIVIAVTGWWLISPKPQLARRPHFTS